MKEAKRSQQKGDEPSMRGSLDTAKVAAEFIRQGKRSFSNDWKAVIGYELALLDLPAAVRTAADARKLRLPDSEAAMTNVDLMITETDSWQDCIAEAAKSFHTSPAEVSAGSFTLFLPAKAFGLDSPNEPALRKGLRFIFGEIISVCRENGIPFEVRGRLANHGTPVVADGRRYISHHTLGADGSGLHIKATDRPSCFSFDTQGYSGWADFAATPLDQLKIQELDPEVVRKFFEAERRIISGNVSKYSQPELKKSDAALPSEYVFVGLQTHKDAVQQLAKIPMLSMLREVAETCKARGMAVVVKRHPKCRSQAIARELTSGEAAGLYKVSDASIHALIAGSCAVCVVNSSVGAEALLHGKPVYVFGAAEYHHVCHRMEAPGDFEKKFRPYEMPVSPDTLQRFLYLLRHEYAVDVTDRATAAESIRRKVLAHVAGDR